MVAGFVPLDSFLTSEQQKVVDCDAPVVLVKAAAGTGKTEILARRVERFVKEPSNGYAHVLAITYTTRAADELTSRLRERLGDLSFRIAARTIHGFAHSILLQRGTHLGLPSGFQLLSSNEDRFELFEQFNNTNSYPDFEKLLFELDLARAKMKDHPELEIWRRALENVGAVDFAEMLVKAYELLQIPALVRIYNRIYGLIIVDEAQNLTEQQYRLLITLAGLNNMASRLSIPIILLGDPKQSIIQFAGADNTLMDRFAEEFNAEKFFLKQNFRSAAKLAGLARDIARRLENGLENDNDLEYPAPGQITVRECLDKQAEGDYIADWVEGLLRNGLPSKALAEKEQPHIKEEEIAVLSRSSSALCSTQSALQARGHKVAPVYSEKDFMSTTLGRISMLLIRRRSAPHRMTAEWGLRRELGVDDLKANDNNGIVDVLRAYPDEHHLNILIPLLEADTLEDLVSTVKECHLPDNGVLDSLLAGWHDDQAFIANTWRNFADSTGTADRSWTRFALHMDRSLRGRDLGPGVRLLTVHKAQGREFKAVAIIGMNDGQFPDFRVTSEQDRKAELNTFYVAVTRASRVLLLTRSCERQTRFGCRSTDPSPYLKYLKAST